VTIINGGKVVVTNTPDGLEASLASGVGYEVEIDGEATEAVKQLQFLLDVRLVEIAPEATKNNRTILKISSEPGTEPGSDIVQVLVNKGNINIVKKVTTPSNLPTATAQLVIGEVASSSKVPRLRSSAYNPIERIGKINKANELITLKNDRKNS
jgi:hypothetical protein